MNFPETVFQGFLLVNQLKNTNIYYEKFIAIHDLIMLCFRVQLK